LPSLTERGPRIRISPPIARHTEYHWDTGHLYPWKGADLVIEAVAALKDARADHRRA
jgi:hypothetical protein